MVTVRSFGIPCHSTFAELEGRLLLYEEAREREDGRRTTHWVLQWTSYIQKLTSYSPNINYYVRQFLVYELN
eukprot:3589672-Amphidinium_carterae.1